MRWAPAALLLLIPELAAAHGGNPAQAYLTTPNDLTIVDDVFLIEWMDAGPPPPPTGSAFVSLFYTTEHPPTFPLQTMPATLTGTAIVQNILEEMEPNQYLWDVSQMPSGHYWIWSRVIDPPEEMSFSYIRFGRVPLTVLHEGDEIGPVIAITEPDTEFATIDQFDNIEYQSWDPTNTARVRFEVSPEVFGEPPTWTVIADNIPAQPMGVIGWNTSSLPEGDWVIRASIEDCNARRFVTYSHHFVLVTHLDPPRDAGSRPPHDGGTLEEWCALPPPDVGVVDTGPPPTDAGATRPDTGADRMEKPKDGCGCNGSGHATPHAARWVLFFLLWRVRPRTGIGDRFRVE